MNLLYFIINAMPNAESSMNFHLIHLVELYITEINYMNLNRLFKDKYNTQAQSPWNRKKIILITNVIHYKKLIYSFA